MAFIDVIAYDAVVLSSAPRTTLNDLVTSTVRRAAASDRVARSNSIPPPGLCDWAATRYSPPGPPLHAVNGSLSPASSPGAGLIDIFMSLGAIAPSSFSSQAPQGIQTALPWAQ